MDINFKYNKFARTQIFEMQTPLPPPPQVPLLSGRKFIHKILFQTKCPYERTGFIELTFLHSERHEISPAQDKNRTSMKGKKNRSEYT